MLGRRTTRITAILLAAIATLVALLGFDFVTQRQKLPPEHKTTWIDV